MLKVETNKNNLQNNKNAESYNPFQTQSHCFGCDDKNKKSRINYPHKFYPHNSSLLKGTKADHIKQPLSFDTNL